MLTTSLLDLEDKIKVLLPAHCIPIGSDVTKRTGEKIYRLEESIKVYADKFITPPAETNPITLDIGPGVRVLFGDNGSINIINAETVLAWVITAGELLAYLQDCEEEYYST